MHRAYRPRGFIVAIIGIDGAGKTTQVRALAAWLTAHGVPADPFANPGGRRALDRLTRRVCERRAVDAVGVHTVLAVETTVRWLSLARAVTVARLRRRTAVMDRYTHCQHANLIARRARGAHLVRLLYAVFPRPDVVVFLHLPPRQAHSRIGRRGTDDEDLDYLIATDRAYRALPEAAAFVVVDARPSPLRVAAALRAAVADQLPGPFVADKA